MRTSALIESDSPNGMSIEAASRDAMMPFAVSKRRGGAWYVARGILESLGLIKWTPAPLSSARLRIAVNNIGIGKGEEKHVSSNNNSFLMPEVSKQTQADRLALGLERPVDEPELSMVRATPAEAVLATAGVARESCKNGQFLDKQLPDA